MDISTKNYTLIEDEHSLEQFYQANRSAKWLSFDTEFIGERRFHTTICLIQVATENGLFLIDPLKIKDLSFFLNLVENQDIIKITHAGENDFRLMYKQFGITPHNVVDTQIAAAFIGYKYPVSFQKLMQSELDISLKKGFTVADWEKRPLVKKQIKYALLDVMFLHDLWTSIQKKLVNLERLDWALNECAALENKSYYELDPDREALNNDFIKNVPDKEKIFLLRLYRWRRKEAERLNYSKEMVLPRKFFNLITRSIPGGIDAMLHHRRIPDSISSKYGKLFVTLYESSPTSEELEVLKKIPVENFENPRQDLLTEMLDLLIKYKCLNNQISHDMVIPRSSIRRMKADANFFEPTLENGWRKQFLGPELIEWLKERSHLELDFSNGRLKLTLENGKEV